MNVSPVAFGFVVSLLLHVLVLGGYAQDAAQLVGKAVLAVIEPARAPDPAANDPQHAAKPKPTDQPKRDDRQPPKPEPTPEPKPEQQPSEKPRPPEPAPGQQRPPRTPEPPPPPEPDVVEVTPGIEGGSPTSMNWIGYDEYQEHLARLATQEQAAFDLEASGGGSRAATQEPQPLPQGPEGQAPSMVDRAAVAEQPATVTPAPVAPTEPTPPAPTPPAVATTTPVEPKPVQPVQPEPSPALSVPGIVPDPTATDRAPTTDPSTVPPTAPDPSKPPEPAVPVPSPTKPDASSAAAPKPAPAPAPIQPTAPAQVEKPGQERPQVPPQIDAPGAATNPNADQPGPVTDGAKSDKQSAATSVIDVPASLWKNGKPLARDGLNIKTRRVELTTLTQVSGSYRNPQCDIYFDHTGKPVQVKIVESSGMKDAVDEPVVDTLYRWRASGRQINQLQPGQLARFRVRIYLR